MKFAQLALLGAVAAQQEDVITDEDLDELIGQRWGWDDAGYLMNREWAIMETLHDLEPDFERAGHRLEKMLKAKVPKYLPVLEAWGKSAAVRAVKAHDKKMMKSGPGKRLIKAIEHTAHDFGKVHWAAYFDGHGFNEWIKNEDLAMMFEDVYEIKESLKALVQTKMAMERHHLGSKAL